MVMIIFEPWFDRPGYSAVMAERMPSGWPKEVRPPGADDWEATAAWLLSEEGIHDQVEAAVAELLEAAGLRIEERDEPVIGSWFRRMWASAKEILRSPAGREAVGVAIHAADTRLVLAQDAAVTAALLQNVPPVLIALQATKDAVLRVGALLIVKVDWVPGVFQLTAAQQAKLDHEPRLLVSPHEIIAALDLTPPGQNGDGPPSLQ
jgi:hypothetical protein